MWLRELPKFVEAVRRWLLSVSRAATAQRASWSRNLTRAIAGLLILNALLSMTACEEPRLPSPFHANDVTGKYAQADFKLQDQHEQTRTLTDFRGKVVLMFFGYTHCPDVCPTTMADLTLALRKLDSKDADRVQVLFVTVDPERDTPALLAQYVPAFDASYLGLWGDVATTAQVTRSFGVSYSKQATKTGYSVDHTAGVYILDTNGKVRLIAPYGQSPEWLAQDVHLLLALQ